MSGRAGRASGCRDETGYGGRRRPPQGRFRSAPANGSRASRAFRFRRACALDNLHQFRHGYGLQPAAWRTQAMDQTPTQSNAYLQMLSLFDPRNWAALAPFAPQSLNQPVLPGWTFGNVITVTEKNSRSPQTEREIVAEHSYGRQLGRLTQALADLIEERPQ